MDLSPKTTTTLRMLAVIGNYNCGYIIISSRHTKLLAYNLRGLRSSKPCATVGCHSVSPYVAYLKQAYCVDIWGNARDIHLLPIITL